MNITSHSVDETIRLGRRLGLLLGPVDVVCVSGDLGAGKTTLVNGIGQGWNSLDRVTSPTYTLVNVYEREADLQRLYHVDAYRLESADAVLSIGLDDILDANGPVVIEWPERISPYLPPALLWIEIRPDPDNSDWRYIELLARGETHRHLLEACRE